MPSSEGRGGTLGSAWLVHSSCTDSPVPQVGHGLSPLHSWDLNLENISGIALGCLSVGRERSLMGPAPQHWTVKTLGMLQMQNGAFWKQNPNNVLQDALFPTFFSFLFFLKSLFGQALYILGKTGAVSDTVFPWAACAAAAREPLGNAPANPSSAHPPGIALLFLVPLQRDVFRWPMWVGRFWQGIQALVRGYFTASPLQGKGSSGWAGLG